MIGHYLLTLTEEQEDRVLTRAIGPMLDADAPARQTVGCLMCAITDRTWNWGGECVLDRNERGEVRAVAREPGYAYEWLCARFGAPRVNAAIRNRILSNRARRTLGASRETPVGVQS